MEEIRVSASTVMEAEARLWGTVLVLTDEVATSVELWRVAQAPAAASQPVAMAWKGRAAVGRASAPPTPATLPRESMQRAAIRRRALRKRERRPVAIARTRRGRLELPVPAPRQWDRRQRRSGPSDRAAPQDPNDAEKRTNSATGPPDDERDATFAPHPFLSSGWVGGCPVKPLRRTGNVPKPVGRWWRPGAFHASCTRWSRGFIASSRRGRTLVYWSWG